MNLDIITPDKTVYSGEIKLIKVPGSQGSFEVLKDHAPIVSSLEKGEVKVISIDGKEHLFNISSGIIEVNSNKVSVLVESIEE